MSTDVIFYEVATRQLDAQIERIGKLDAKATTVFAFASTVLAVFAGFSSLSLVSTTGQARALFLAMLVGAVVIYAILLVFLYRCYQSSSRFDYRPSIGALEDLCKTREPGPVRVWIGQEAMRSLTVNAPLLEDKARNLQVGLILLPIETLFLLAAAFIHLLGS